MSEPETRAPPGCWLPPSRSQSRPLPAHAGTPQPPDWVLTAAHASTPDYPKTTMAVVLDDEETLTVQPDGKATVLKRRVIKILRPQGRGFATVVVPIDRDRKLRSLHVWGIASDGHPYTLRDNEIVEVGDNEYGMLYVDLHAKVARAPAADPGAVVAYEYERTERPYVQEYTWNFQDSIPTLHSVFELILPPDWHYSVASRNAVAGRKDDIGVVTSQPAPGHYRWQLDRISGVDIEDVPMTPEFEAMAGRLVVRYSRDPQPTGDDRWTAIGNWYTTLASPSAQATPDLSAKAKELVAGQSDFTAKVQAIAGYMQRNIRYVGIEIGIGGLQPHTADDDLPQPLWRLQGQGHAAARHAGERRHSLHLGTGRYPPRLNRSQDPLRRRQPRHRRHRAARRLHQSCPAVRRHGEERQALSHLRSHQPVDPHRPDPAL